MARLLVIGTKIPRLTCIEWQDCVNHNLLDYQGLLMDCREPSLVSQAPNLPKLLDPLMFHRHTVFIILPVVQCNLDILPFLRLDLRLIKGKTLQISNQSQFIDEYVQTLQGHEITITATQTTLNIPHGWKWGATVCDNVGRAICGQYASAYILHPPPASNERAAINTILNFFNPDYAEPEAVLSPDWAASIAITLPGMDKLQETITIKKDEIATLQSQVDREEIKKAELARWTEILWLDGVPLQNRVSEALEFLGIPNKSSDLTDLTGIFCTSGSEREFTLEGSWNADEEIQTGADRHV